MTLLYKTVKNLDPKKQNLATRIISAFLLVFFLFLKNPSIHPLSTSSDGHCRHPPRHHSPAPPGYPEAFLGQMRYRIPPVSSGSALGSPPSLTCLEYLQRDVSRRHPNQMSNPQHPIGKSPWHALGPGHLPTLPMR